MIRTATLLAATLALSACQQDVNTQNVVGNVLATSDRPERDDWQTLGDSSQVVIKDRRSGETRMVTIVRCWGSSPYDCMVALADQRPNGDWDFLITRESRTELHEAIVFAPENDNGGYRCQILTGPRGGGMFEKIWSGQSELAEHGTLASQRYAQPWTRDYVENFMRDNNVSRGDPYFNCRAVSDQIRFNTPMAIGTTAFTHDMFAGDAGAIDMSSRME